MKISIVSGFLLVLVLVPGMLYFLLTGKPSKPENPQGWLYSMAVGFLLCVPAGIIFSLSCPATLNSLFSGNFDAAKAFALGVYLTVICASGVFYLVRADKGLAKLSLKAEKRFFNSNALLVPKNLIEHLFCICYVAGIIPKIIVETKDSRKYNGYCLRYKWADPEIVLLAETKNSEKHIITVKDIRTFSLVNWKELVKTEKKINYEYLDMIHPFLKEWMKEESGQSKNVKY